MGSDELLLFSTDYPHWQFEGDRRDPAGLDAGARAENHGGQPAGDLSRLTSEQRDGDHADERRRPEAARRPPPPASRSSRIADCDIHPRRGAASAASARRSIRTCRSAGRSIVRDLRRALPPAMGAGARPIPKGQPQACRRDAWPPGGGPPGSDLGFMARAASRPEQRRARHPQPADQRPGRAGPRSVGRAHARHQRVAGGRVDLARCAAEGLGRGAVRGRGRPR